MIRLYKDKDEEEEKKQQKIRLYSDEYRAAWDERDKAKLEGRQREKAVKEYDKQLTKIEQEIKKREDRQTLGLPELAPTKTRAEMFLDFVKSPEIKRQKEEYEGRKEEAKALRQQQREHPYVAAPIEPTDNYIESLDIRVEEKKIWETLQREGLDVLKTNLHVQKDKITQARNLFESFHKTQQAKFDKNGQYVDKNVQQQEQEMIQQVRSLLKDDTVEIPQGKTGHMHYFRSKDNPYAVTTDSKNFIIQLNQQLSYADRAIRETDASVENWEKGAMGEIDPAKIEDLATRWNEKKRIPMFLSTTMASGYLILEEFLKGTGKAGLKMKDYHENEEPLYRLALASMASKDVGVWETFRQQFLDDIEELEGAKGALKEMKFQFQNPENLPLVGGFTNLGKSDLDNAVLQKVKSGEELNTIEEIRLSRIMSEQYYGWRELSQVQRTAQSQIGSLAYMVDFAIQAKLFGASKIITKTGLPLAKFIPQVLKITGEETLKAGLTSHFHRNIQYMEEFIKDEYIVIPTTDGGVYMEQLHEGNPKHIAFARGFGNNYFNNYIQKTYGAIFDKAIGSALAPLNKTLRSTPMIKKLNENPTHSALVQKVKDMTEYSKGHFARDSLLGEIQTELLQYQNDKLFRGQPLGWTQQEFDDIVLATTTTWIAMSPIGISRKGKAINPDNYQLLPPYIQGLIDGKIIDKGDDLQLSIEDQRDIGRKITQDLKDGKITVDDITPPSEVQQALRGDDAKVVAPKWEQDLQTLRTDLAAKEQEIAQRDAVQQKKATEPVYTEKTDVKKSDLTKTEAKALDEVVYRLQGDIDAGRVKVDMTPDEQGNYVFTKDGVALPEYVPEGLRSRKTLQNAIDAHLEGKMPQEGTKAWQAYQVLLEQAKEQAGDIEIKPKVPKAKVKEVLETYRELGTDDGSGELQAIPKEGDFVTDQIKKYKEYTLETVDISTLLKQDKQFGEAIKKDPEAYIRDREYEPKMNVYEPIIIAGQAMEGFKAGDILDGMGRVNALMKRGEKTIEAYVPVEDSSVKPKVKVKKDDPYITQQKAELDKRGIKYSKEAGARELEVLLALANHNIKHDPKASFAEKEAAYENWLSDNLLFRRDKNGNQVLKVERLKPMEADEVVSLNQRFFHDNNIGFVKKILTPEGQKALGKYKDTWISLLDGQAQLGSTFYHEAAHKAFDMLLTNQEQRILLDLVIKKVGKQTLTDMWKIQNTQGKMRLANFQGAGFRMYNDSLIQVQQTGFGIKDGAATHRLKWKGKENLFKNWVEKYNIDPNNVFNSLLEIKDVKTNERTQYFIEGEQDAVHAQTLIDGQAPIAGEVINGKIYHLTALKPSDLGVHSNIQGKFDPKRLPYSQNPINRGVQQEYRSQFDITQGKQKVAKYRGQQFNAKMIDAMAEEYLVENLISFVDNRGNEVWTVKMRRMIEALIDRIRGVVENITDINSFYKHLVNGDLIDRQERRMQKQQKRMQKQVGNIAGSRVKTDAVYRQVYAKEVQKLTTKVLKMLEGKESVKKVFIENALKSGLTKPEIDITTEVLKGFGETVNVAQFEQEILKQLLPLDRTPLSSDGYMHVALKDDIRGDVLDYTENIYQSPIEVEAGQIHFDLSMGDIMQAEDQVAAKRDDKAADHYFGHTRVETLAGDVRRIIEIQSDLYQRGGVEAEIQGIKNKSMNYEMREGGSKAYMTKIDYKTYEEANDQIGYAREQKSFAQIGQKKDLTVTQAEKLEAKNMRISQALIEKYKDRFIQREVAKLQKLEQYKNPTAHMRMLREEIRQASVDGVKTLLLPTGQTAMAVEGLGEHSSWSITSAELKVNKIIADASNKKWLITDVLGEGKFKALPVDVLNQLIEKKYPKDADYTKVFKENERNYRMYIEQFDLGETTDINNPIYKFYEDEIGKYTRNKYDAKLHTDDKGVTWWKVDIKPEYSEAVEAFRLADNIDTRKVADQVDPLKETDYKKRLQEQTVRVALPELIGLAEDLGTKVSVSDRTSKFMGVMARGVFKTVGDSDPSIKILRDLFTPQGEVVLDESGKEVKLDETREQQRDRMDQIERTLAHEIGHLFDWFGGEDNKTLKRGNLLGRIANLKRYMEGEFRELENVEIRNELKTLSQIWKPFDEKTVPKKYKNYRYSASELYADAISVLLNDVSLLKRVAPKFYDGWLEYLARKEEVQQEFFKTLDLIQQGKEVAERLDKMEEGFKEGTGRRMDAIERRDAYLKQAKWNKAWTQVKYGFQEIYAPYLDRLRTMEKKRELSFPRLAEAEMIMSNLDFIQDDQVMYADKLHKEFFNPVSEAGISIDDVGKILVLERDLGDRVDLANPQGLQYDYAKETYQKLKEKFNPAQWTLLEEKLQMWRDLHFEYVTKAYEAGYFSQQFYDEIATVNKNTYTPFAVIHYIDTNHVGAGVIQAKGTLSKVENPINTQMLKTMSLMRETQVTLAKNHMVKTFKENFEGEITPVKAIRDKDGRIVTWERNAPLEQEGYKIFELHEEGKRTAYYMPEHMAEMFEKLLNISSERSLNIVMSGFRAFNRIFKPAVTTFSPSFLFWGNPLRDIPRSMVNLSGLSAHFQPEVFMPLRVAGTMTYFSMAYIANLKRSWDMAGGVYDDKTIKLINLHVFPAKLTHMGIDTTARDLQAQMTETGDANIAFDPATKKVTAKGIVNWGDKAIEWMKTKPVLKYVPAPILEGMLRSGMTLERADKMASFDLMTKNWGVQENIAGFLSRRNVGTPDFKTRGKYTPILNEYSVFSNAQIQAVTIDSRLATHPKTAGSWWFSMFLTAVIPKLLQLLAESTMKTRIPDPEDEENTIEVNPYDYLSEWDKTYYNNIILGYDEETKKFLHLRVPTNEAGRVVGTAIWKMAKFLQGEGMKPEHLGAIAFSYIPMLGGSNPFSNVSEGWFDYIRGRNPYDDFRGRPAIHQAKWEEGGATRFKEMIKFTTNQMGVTKFFTFDRDVDQWYETVLRMPLIERMFRLTDYGLYEQKEWDKAMAKREKSKDLDNLLKLYYNKPSDKYMLELQDKYVKAVMGDAPKDGWTGHDKAQETRLQGEFKEAILAESGKGIYTRLVAQRTNDDKINQIELQRKKMDKQEFTDYITEVVRHEVLKGWVFAEYAEEKNLDKDIVYNVVKKSIPVLNADANNTLLWELRKRDMLTNDQLAKLVESGLLTKAGYAKYREVTKLWYERRYSDTKPKTEPKPLF